MISFLPTAFKYCSDFRHYRKIVLTSSFNRNVFLSMVQPLASSLPARLQKGSKSSEHPALRSTAAELLQKYTTPDDESGESDSEREADDEELGQNSDSAVGELSEFLKHTLSGNEEVENYGYDYEI